MTRLYAVQRFSMDRRIWGLLVDVCAAVALAVLQLLPAIACVSIRFGPRGPFAVRTSDGS
jgi:hypothetical protein